MGRDEFEPGAGDEFEGWVIAGKISEQRVGVWHRGSSRGGRMRVYILR